MKGVQLTKGCPSQDLPAASAQDLNELAAIINRAHDSAQPAFTTYSQHAKTAGKALIALKKIVGHGKFYSWLAANTGVSPGTARRYMAEARGEAPVAKKRGKRSQMSVIPNPSPKAEAARANDRRRAEPERFPSLQGSATGLRPEPDPALIPPDYSGQSDAETVLPEDQIRFHQDRVATDTARLSALHASGLSNVTTDAQRTEVLAAEPDPARRARGARSMLLAGCSRILDAGTTNTPDEMAASLTEEDAMLVQGICDFLALVLSKRTPNMATVPVEKPPIVQPWRPDPMKCGAVLDPDWQPKPIVAPDPVKQVA
jgi:hypothetical protein